MGKLQKNESGFSVVEIVLVLVIVALIGTVGWLVYKNHHKTATVSTTNTSSNKPATTTKTPTSTTTQPVNPYAGWASCSDSNEGISIKYPSSWTTSGLGTAGACTVGSENGLSVYSPQVSGVPYFFKVQYTPPSAWDGTIDGDNGTETILSVQPLNVSSSKVPLYLVSFNAPGESSSSDVFEFVLTDQSYTVGQTVSHVIAAASQKVNGGHYSLTANMVTDKNQQYLGQYTLAQYQAQPDYSNVVKIFQSIIY